MEGNPLETVPLFHLGPIPIAASVATTWGVMAALTLVSWLGLRHAKVEAGGLQSALEIVVETVETQLRAIIGQGAAPYLPLLATLFLYLLTANLVAALPGVEAPTASIETPAALALIVFFSTHVFGVRARGLRGYLSHYFSPSPLLAPLNILAEITRTFSLMVRLFGNMMSHALVLTIIATLAGLFVPVPFLALGVLIGVIQAYIFTVLATVYLGAAAGSVSIE